MLRKRAICSSQAWYVGVVRWPQGCSMWGRGWAGSGRGKKTRRVKTDWEYVVLRFFELERRIGDGIMMWIKSYRHFLRRHTLSPWWTIGHRRIWAISFRATKCFMKGWVLWRWKTFCAPFLSMLWCLTTFTFLRVKKESTCNLLTQAIWQRRRFAPIQSFQPSHH